MIKENLNIYNKKINDFCDSLINNDEHILQKDVLDAMRYSLISDGKKIRPALVFEFAKACGISNEYDAINFAAAVEMVHTYSLIHDDLPCMDDDDLRRGKPSCHIKFGEDIALLAGDALLSLAFETIANATNKVSHRNVVNAVRTLAFCSGAMGMVGGQVIDLQSEGKSIPISTLKKMHQGKTGMMIRASALLGCYAADASEEQINAAISYANDIGLVFQIIDDVLDVISDTDTFGKPVGSDMENGKTTYATLYSIEECYNMAEKITENAKTTVKGVFGKNSAALCELADMLLNRKH